LKLEKRVIILVEKGKLIGIGVGPGDTELLTIKAVNILSKIPVICSPKSSEKKDSIALSIVKPILDKREDIKDLTILDPVFPMTEDRKTLEKHWDEATNSITNYLDKGVDVAFITLGDPAIFSTFSYVLKRLTNEYIVKMVPGITSCTACASSIGKPLVEKNEVLTIIPKIDDRLESILNESNSIVLMKPSRNTKELEDIIDSKSGEKEIYSVEKCSMEDEKIIKGFSKDKPYLTTTLIKFNEK